MFEIFGQNSGRCAYCGKIFGSLPIRMAHENSEHWNKGFFDSVGKWDPLPIPSTEGTERIVDDHEP